MIGPEQREPQWVPGAGPRIRRSSRRARCVWHEVSESEGDLGGILSCGRHLNGRRALLLGLWAEWQTGTGSIVRSWYIGPPGRLCLAGADVLYQRFRVQAAQCPGVSSDFQCSEAEQRRPTPVVALGNTHMRRVSWVMDYRTC